jgi:hypothetical protein
MKTQMLSGRNTAIASVLSVKIGDIDFPVSNTPSTMILTQDKVPRSAGDLLNALLHQHRLTAIASNVSQSESQSQSMKSILATIASITHASQH